MSMEVTVNADGTIGEAHYPGFAFDFERYFDAGPATFTLQRHYWSMTITSVIGYLTFIYFGQKWMAARPAYQLTRPLKYWNAALAVFSIFGAWRHLSEMYHVYTVAGLHGTLCTSSIADSIASYWAEKFAISKLIEYGDTVFLVLRKRPVTFLHWFHHTTVLAYTWHGVKDSTIPGRWFITMNYTVHAVMYTYYTICSSGFRFPKWCSASITTMQLMQMLIGCVVQVYSYSQLKQGNFCLQTWENVYMGTAMYASYLALFAHFFYMAYMKPGGRGVKSDGTNGVANGKNGVANGKNGVANGSNGVAGFTNGVKSTNGTPAAANGKAHIE
jgi:elongation of very long chain fatty acids protein 6